ncbi:MAG: MFS transporter [Acidilobaceae archaeon]
MIERVLLAFLLLSLVSLFADITYEGGRSISGSFLKSLEAPVIATSILAFGELLSYAFRLAGGLIAYRLASIRVYWTLIALGYGLNVAVPLLALATDWRLALLLFLLERAGKGIRTPIRDAVIAEITEGIGRGKAFAIHEVLDQIGGVVGPLTVSLAIAWSDGSYKIAYGILAVPFVVSMFALQLAWRVYRPRSSIEKLRRESENSEVLNKSVLFLIFVLFLGAGFLHWSQASYRLKELGLEDFEIAWLYALAMLCDGLVAIPLGLTFDRLGLRSLLVIPVAVVLSGVAFAFNSSLFFALLWGTAMSSLETMLKAAVACFSEARERPLLYALTYISLGAGWVLGNLFMSIIGVSLAYMFLVEVLAILALIAFIRRVPNSF